MDTIVIRKASTNLPLRVIRCTSRSGATRRNGSKCVDLVEVSRIVRKQLAYTFYVAMKSSQKKENRIVK